MAPVTGCQLKRNCFVPFGATWSCGCGGAAGDVTLAAASMAAQAAISVLFMMGSLAEVFPSKQGASQPRRENIAGSASRGSVEALAERLRRLSRSHTGVAQSTDMASVRGLRRFAGERRTVKKIQRRRGTSFSGLVSADSSG